MRINDIIFLLLGLLISLLITYIVIIRKFNNFINNEIENNKVYRENAEKDYNIASGTVPDTSANGGPLNEK